METLSRVYQLPTRVTPGVSRRWSTSCLRMRRRHCPTEECWITSRTFGPPLIQGWLRVVKFSWALHSSPISPKRRVQLTSPSGGPGRKLHTGGTRHHWRCWPQNVIVDKQYCLCFLSLRLHYSSKRRTPPHRFLPRVLLYCLNCLLLHTRIGAFNALQFDVQT